MKIAIEGQRLFRTKKHGMDMVALELIRNLQKIDKKNEYIVFVKPDEDKCLQDTENFKIVELKGGPYPVWEQWALPRAVEKYGCDVLHCTSNTAPIFGKTPLVVILHDIIYLESISILKKAGSWYQKFGNMYRRWVVPHVVKRSKKVVTVSNYEKERIGKFFGFGKEKLTAIYNGVGEHFKKVTDEAYLKSIKEKYNLPDDFFFFLGNTDPKKNTKGVLQAFADFNTQSSKTYKLVMLDYDKAELKRLLDEIGHPEQFENIFLTGYVPNIEMPAIINQCKLFLYPSLRESFGIPILEGMACGVPVITSNTSSMPEVAGDAACIVDPHNPEEITQAMQRILIDDDYRNELCRKGMERASHFSWKRMAEENLKLYKELTLKEEAYA
ncbi:glycosyltransferase family 4 protein [Marinifilum flexuosum]|uniref:Glycosyltransferase involved in cell wall biosynthesis n=1 Tax=Marinifilum flexuosum TaxID=1117708 RepID=A0A419X347_9BACT|nr:glycosyltransferase family 1 protein [Marinifilum flexuosum]RKE02141.1 glycosyltransferase involved in cell wall biosynthesis [Marinifilum flexuosum]